MQCIYLFILQTEMTSFLAIALLTLCTLVSKHVDHYDMFLSSQLRSKGVQREYSQ